MVYVEWEAGKDLIGRTEGKWIRERGGRMLVKWTEGVWYAE